MKTSFKTIFMCGILFPVSALAEITDVSTIENVVYLNPVNANTGSDYVLSVRMKNTAVIESFGFDLVLPDGITVATDGEGYAIAELSTERTTTKKTNVFSADFKGDGSLNVQAYSTTAGTIDGNDGEVVKITIRVSSSMEEGTYPIILKNVAVADVSAVSYRTETVESSITIAKGDSRTVLDENSTTAPTAATGVDVRVRRTITAGDWNTICLPFAMSEAQTKAAFGDGVQIADFVDHEIQEDADENIVGIEVNFKDVTAIDANHPYIIKVSSAISEFTVDGVDIDPDEDRALIENDNGKSGSRRVVYSGFYGTYHAQTEVPKYCMFLSGNNFWYSLGLTKMKAFRAFFEFADRLTDVENAYPVKMFIHHADDETGIEEVQMSNGSNDGEIYDLAGRRMEKAGKGIYIINNKKVLVK